MGTRNLTCVVKDGEYKVGQYGQWDGSPSGQGFTILEYLKRWDRKKFEDSLDTIEWITEEECQNCFKQAGISKTAEYLTSEESERFKRLFPHLNRNMAGEILDYIESNKNLKLNNSVDFAYDGLFCEWAYVIDLDKNTFEVYEGGITKPISKDERFFTENLIDYQGITTQYYPVSLIKSFSLDDLPSKEIFLIKTK